MTRSSRVDDVKALVKMACRDLWVEKLALFSQGNASMRFGPAMYIKASGAWCGAVQPDEIVAVGLPAGDYDADGKAPSTDAAAHALIYNTLPDIGGIVHTHSTYASAWACAGLAIPCCTTGQADIFGGDIPCGAYCPIGTEDIGKEILRLYEYDKRRRAFLIRQHGVFTIGKTANDAVRTAIFVEHFAQVTWLAEKLAGLKRIPQAEIDANFERYHTTYGQSAKHPEPDRQPARAGDR